MDTKQYLIKREVKKEFATGGEVTVAVTYNINHPKEMHRAPEWVKELAAKDQLGIMEQRLISAKPLSDSDKVKGIEIHNEATNPCPDMRGK